MASVKRKQLTTPTNDRQPSPATDLTASQVAEIVESISFLKEIKIVSNEQLKLTTLDTISRIPNSEEIMEKYLQ